MNAMEQFYSECINSKIAQCEHEAEKINADAHCNKHHYEVMRAQAIFFDDRKEELVRAMLDRNLGPNVEAVDNFLLNCFVTGFASAATVNLKSKGATDTVDSAELMWDEASLRKMCEPVSLSAYYRLDPERIPNLLKNAWAEGSFSFDDLE